MRCAVAAVAILLAGLPVTSADAAAHGRAHATAKHAKKKSRGPRRFVSHAGRPARAPRGIAMTPLWVGQPTVPAIGDLITAGPLTTEPPADTPPDPAANTPTDPPAHPPADPPVDTPRPVNPPTDTTTTPPTADTTLPFSPTSFWNKPLGNDALLDPDSPLLVLELMRQVALYTPWVNATTYSTPVYTVPAGQPEQHVYLDTPSSMYTNAAGADIVRSQIEDVPIPEGAHTAAGVNHHIVIWQPSTDTMWELWNAHHVPDEPCPWHHDDVDGWHAAWGAQIDNASKSDGVVSAPAGATASGLPLLGGLIRLDEWKSGHIDHALAFAIPDIKRGAIVPPATRTDGRYDGPDGIPMGTRFRLDPSLDIDSLHLDPAVAMIAKAAQKYGMVVRDHADDSLVFYGEDPAPTGENPYPSILGTRPDRLLRKFPWSRLQALPPTN